MLPADFILIMLLINSSNNSTRAAIIAELAQVNALPCAEVKTSAGDRYGQADAEEGALGMGWHIIQQSRLRQMFKNLADHQMASPVFCCKIFSTKPSSAGSHFTDLKLSALSHAAA